MTTLSGISKCFQIYQSSKRIDLVVQALFDEIVACQQGDDTPKKTSHSEIAHQSVIQAKSVVAGIIGGQDQSPICHIDQSKTELSSGNVIKWVESKPNMK